ncbi:hypothetical protein, partial [Burkholderia ubonensis]|uniref:hypothetical protein n=1 Tax=Burkholderia ubonensis TaxID=101571 RepID=UPI001E368F16
RLLIFKERVCEKTVFLSSAALSAAEKGDYEHCFAVRQQLFYKLRCDCGVHLPSPFRAALPSARKRRDSRHLPRQAQGVSRNKFKSPRALPRTGAFELVSRVSQRPWPA